jgi:hypothetical protein
VGYLNNSVVTIDAILTKKGRELLARGDGSAKITQIALADDEIDYTLYNQNHPSGSAFYGEAIENMPLLEAFPDETQIMKYKLTTLPRGTAKLPVLDIGYTSIRLKQGASLAITPQTLNYLGAAKTFETNGYVVTIADSRVTSTFNGVGISTTEADRLNTSTTLGTNVSKTVIGTSLSMKATGVNLLFQNSNSITTTLTIVGNDSGVRMQIPVIITKN